MVVAAEYWLSAFMIVSAFGLSLVSTWAHSGKPDPPPIETNCELQGVGRNCRLIRSLGLEAVTLYDTADTIEGIRDMHPLQ